MSQRKEREMHKGILISLIVAFALAGLAVAVPVAKAGHDLGLGQPGQSQQAMISDKLQEIGAWAVPSSTQPELGSKPPAAQSQQAMISDKLQEIGAWAVPSSTKPELGSKPLVSEKLAGLDPWAFNLFARSHRLSEHSTPGPLPAVSVASSDGFDWADAGIGAAFVFGTMLFGAASVITVRRHHGPVAH